MLTSMRRQLISGRFPERHFIAPTSALLVLLCSGSFAATAFGQTAPVASPPPPPPPARVHVEQGPHQNIGPPTAPRPVTPATPAPTYVHPTSDNTHTGAPGNAGSVPRPGNTVAPLEGENPRSRETPPAATPVPTPAFPTNSGAPRSYPDPTNLGRPTEAPRPAPVINYTPLPRSTGAPMTPPVAHPVPMSGIPYGANRSPEGGGSTSTVPRMQTRPIYNVNSGAVAGTTPEGASNLNANGSRQVLADVNTSRSHLPGVNGRPIPQGTVTVQPTGHLTVAADNGREYNLRPNGTIASYQGPNTRASFAPDGRVASLRTANMTITNTAHGQRVITTQRADSSIVVSVGRNSGYVERPIVSGGVTYQQRTWVYGGSNPGRFQRTALYVPYRYRGVGFFHYVPRFTYVPAFYGWAYYGWGRPYCYNWGYSNDPWYGFYGSYYSPTPCYSGANAWLADYYLSQTLASGYQQYDPNQGQDPGYGYSNGQQPPPDAYQQGAEDLYAQTDTPISPAIKDLIAQEVQQQIAAENAASSQPGGQAYNLTDLPQVMQPSHVFVVGQPLNVITFDQLSCSLSAGNVLQLQSAPPDGTPVAALAVLSSRRGDCPAGVQVTVALSDLEEMQNNLRAQLDTGLNTLYNQQGQNGLPPAPEAAIAPPPRPAPDFPADNENVQALIAQQQQQAAQAEQQATQQAFPPQP